MTTSLSFTPLYVSIVCCIMIYCTFDPKEYPTLSSSTIAMISGAVAGFISSFLFYPLDTIEARQQMDSRIMNKSFIESARYIWTQEGIDGYYIAWEPGVFGIAMNWAVYFWIYDTIKRQWIIQWSSTTAFVDFWSGIVAGCCTSVIMNPIWVVKARMITVYSETKEIPSVRRIWIDFWSSSDDAWKQLYAGVLISMTGCLQGAIQFMLYEMIVSQWSSSSGIFFIAGVLSNAFATVLTFPYLTIRSAVQSTKEDTTVQRCIDRIYQDHGWKGFYSGLQANLIRQPPTSGCMLFVMEHLKQWLLKH